MGENFDADQRSRLTESRTAVAEQRGVWTTVLLAGEGGFSALCVTAEPPGFFGGGGMVGSLGVSAVAAPGPKDVVATDLATFFISGPGELSLAAGLIGAEVTAVTYRSPSDDEVDATVDDGRFVFWLPGNALGSAFDEGADVEITYRDGTTPTLTLDLR